ncbi:MAG: glycosyltransferase family 4 protein [candidate division Zixibacteria bacterium]|nr:glycosyltransferase family 4 protein [candidate division Zixibacteria bacterium]
MQSTVLTVGRLVPRKGQIYLIDAMRKLVDEGMDLKLVIIGIGPEENRLRERAKGLDFRLELIISDEQLEQEYKNADVFVLPSITDEQGEKEGLGLVLLESMHFKLPVIAFDNGGVSEVVIDGYNGILLQEKDVDGLAVSIKKVLTDKEFSDKLVETAYKDAHKRFSVETIVNQQAEIYDRVLEHR